MTTSLHKQIRDLEGDIDQWLRDLEILRDASAPTDSGSWYENQAEQSELENRLSIASLELNELYHVLGLYPG